MSIVLDGPIPGQSLTREPGNAPWEQPPLYADNQQALAWHLKNLSPPERGAELIHLLENGFPVQTFVESLLTKAQMEGYHTIDTSVLIAPVIHQYVRDLAESAGIKYKEWAGPTPEQIEKEKLKRRITIGLAGQLKNPEIPTPQETTTPTPTQTGLINRRK